VIEAALKNIQLDCATANRPEQGRSVGRIFRGFLENSLANHLPGELSNTWAWRCFTKEPYVETGDDRGAGGAGGGRVAADGVRVSRLLR